METAKPRATKPFRILSLDGGGVRAIISATILTRLASEFPDLMNEIDMFTGVSAGAIVSVALASGLTPEQTSNIWRTAAPKIFVEGYRHKFSTIDNCIGSAYDTSQLKEMLSQTLGNKTIGDLEKKILVPSFNLDPVFLELSGSRRWGPEYFHNFPNSIHKELPLIDAVLRTAAAPPYFPIHQGYVDGGTFANNPSLAAISTALNYGVKYDDLVVLSISTGNNPKCITKQEQGTGDWGLVEWGPYVVDLLLDSNTESINYSCNCILHDRYKRVDPILPKNIGLDDASAIPDLIDIANKVDLDTVRDWLKSTWKYGQANDGSTIISTKAQVPEPNSARWGCSIQ